MGYTMVNWILYRKYAKKRLIATNLSHNFQKEIYKKYQRIIVPLCLFLYIP